MTRDLIVELKDGRNLGYAEYGDPNGKPIFFFHGSHGSRLLGGLFDESARKMKLRIVAPERPGFGLSTFQDDRHFLDWPDDMEELADNLGIKKFGVIGYSGGTIYATACAYKIPRRLGKVVLVSSAVPYEMRKAYEEVALPVKMIEFMVANLPRTTRLFLRYSKWMTFRAPRMKLALTRRNLAKSSIDTQILDPTGESGKHLINVIKESYRSGIWGNYHEWQLYGQPWGFDPRDITHPISIWVGEKDVVTPLEMGETLARLLPKSKLKIVPKEGHYSLIFDYRSEILKEFVSSKTAS